MATARDSALYTSLVTNKQMPDARDMGGRLLPVYFEVTTVSAAATGDTYKLFVLPANWAVAFCYVITNGMGDSAGAGVILEIGDSGDADRFIDGLDVSAAKAFATIAYAGIGYRPTVDTPVVATITSTHVAGTLFKGYFWMIPPV